MRLKFDKYQWKVDTEKMKPKEFFYNLKTFKSEDNSLLQYGIFAFLYPMMFLFFMVASPFIFLHSIKVVKGGKKYGQRRCNRIS
jgi:hypothetical protein